MMIIPRALYFSVRTYARCLKYWITFSALAACFTS